MDDERICLNNACFKRVFEKEINKIRWTTFVWRVQNYSKLKEDVMYFRKSRWFGEKWSIKLTKTEKLLFLILNADDGKLFVNFTILGRDGNALNEGVASEFVGGQYVADVNRDLFTEKNGYLVDDRLTIQCKYIEEQVRDALPYGHPLNHSGETEMNCLRTALTSALRTGMCSDIKICVPPMEFTAHKVVLALRSEYFEGMFEEESLEVNYTKIQFNADPSIFYKMLLYIYTAEFHETNIYDVLDLIDLALIFDVNDLVSKCLKFLYRNITVKNVLAVFLMASEYACTELKNHAFRFMTNECPELLKNEEVKKYLNPKQSKELAKKLPNVIFCHR